VKVKKVPELLRLHLTRKVVCDVCCHDTQMGAMVTEDCHHHFVCLRVEFENI
jgi:hypothetical protein